MLGVIAMFSAILILLAMPFTDLSRYRGLQFRPLSKVAFFIFLGNFLILMELGAKHVESPFIEFGQISTVLYFAHFLIIVPFLSLLENSLIELECRTLQDDKKLYAKNFKPALAKSSILNTFIKIIRFAQLNNTPAMSYCAIHDSYYKTGTRCLCCAFAKLSLNRNIYLYLVFAIVVTFIIWYTLFFDVNIIPLLYSTFQPEYCDAPRPWGIYFQDSATPQMEGLVELHDNILFYLVIILFGVGWILISTVRSYTSIESPISHKYLNHGKFVPIQKCFKFNNIFYTSKMYVAIRTYTALPSSPINSKHNYVNLSYIIICLYLSLIILFSIYIFFGIAIFHSFFPLPFLFTLSFFYLEGFKLSDKKSFKIIQILFFFGSFIILFIIYNYAISIDIINYAKDNNIDLHAHAHVSVDKEAGKAIGQGLSTIGSQIALGATMIGIGGAAGKTIAKSGVPPIQKVGFILGASLIGGLGHSRLSALNRNEVATKNAETSTFKSTPTADISSTANINSGTETSSHINKLVDDSHVSPLQELLFNGEIMSYVCLGLIYLLIIQLIFKLYLKDNISLNFSKLLGNNVNIKVEFYLNKIIKLNKQMSIIWIWFGFITILFALGIEGYTLHYFCINLHSFINVHISLYPKILNSMYVSDKSIKDILLNLKIINYISILSVVSLMSQIMLKFHFNKNKNTIFIWLALSVLFLTLGFTAYTYEDLYTNLDSYVKMYTNLTK